MTDAHQKFARPILLLTLLGGWSFLNPTPVQAQSSSKWVRRASKPAPQVGTRKSASTKPGEFVKPEIAGKASVGSPANAEEKTFRIVPAAQFAQGPPPVPPAERQAQAEAPSVQQAPPVQTPPPVLTPVPQRTQSVPTDPKPPVEATPEPEETSPTVPPTPPTEDIPDLPPAPLPAPTPSISGLTGLTGDYTYSQTRSRLASVPDMFGDFLWRNATLRATGPLNSNRKTFGAVDMPVAGGGRRTLVGDINKPLPVDRFYFSYNYFHNAVSSMAAASPGSTRSQDANVHRYTVGWEQTFGEDNWSVNFRMPFASDQNFLSRVSGGPDGRVASGGGRVGNLAVILKRILYSEDDLVLAAGLGVETPTGSNAAATIGRLHFREENQAVFLLPFIAFMHTPSEDNFYQAFLQLSAPTNSNPVELTDLTGDAPRTIGKYTDQTLLHFNVSCGEWLTRDPCSNFCTGIAALVELHYTAALEDSDQILGTEIIDDDIAGFLLTDDAKRAQMLNVATGFHTEFCDGTTLRVASIFPLLQGSERAFDGELTVQFIRRY